MKYFIFTLSLVISNLALASKPYGMAGCGLGSVLNDKNGNQVVAATTNWTGTQTFGISSGTSNCVTATEQTARIKNFIEANYDSLITDMAKGHGDSVHTLSGMYGCEREQFADVMKAHYTTITPENTDATFVMVRINDVIADSAALNSSCRNVL